MDRTENLELYKPAISDLISESVENVFGDNFDVIDTAITEHITDKNNPHEVTAAKIGLGNVTNESKETMFASPVFTGTPTAPTAASETNNTQVATTSFVHEVAILKAHTEVDTALSNWKYEADDTERVHTITGSTSSFDDICDFNGTKIVFRFGGEVGFYISLVVGQRPFPDAYFTIYKNGTSIWNRVLSNSYELYATIAINKGDALSFEYGFNNVTGTFKENSCTVTLQAKLKHIGFDIVEEEE